MARSHISLLQQIHQTQKIRIKEPMNIKVAIKIFNKSSNDASLKKLWGGAVAGKNKRGKKIGVRLELELEIRQKLIFQ